MSIEASTYEGTVCFPVSVVTEQPDIPVSLLRIDQWLGHQPVLPVSGHAHLDNTGHTGGTLENQPVYREEGIRCMYNIHLYSIA